MDFGGYNSVHNTTLGGELSSAQFYVTFPMESQLNGCPLGSLHLVEEVACKEEMIIRGGGTQNGI